VYALACIVETMQQRQLGRDGPLVPVIGFGAWPIGGGMGTIDERQAIATLHHAFEQGVTFVDTAEAYRSSEAAIGRALATWSGPRERVFLATKVRSDDLSAAHVAEAVEQSLRLLGVETIDLVQAHGWDTQHPIEETIDAFTRLVQAGKVRFVGVSNFDVAQMQAAWDRRPFQSLQPRYNLLEREAEAAILPYCERQGIGVLAHSPLAKGLLTGRYRAGHVFPADDERSQMQRFQGDEFRGWLARSEALEGWARARGHSLLELAIAWVLAHPAVTVCLCGAKSPAQVDDHIRAAAWQLSAADRADVERLVSVH
jgi:aryl-alcohol dehydrogenase-like predicted oxidoreductase